MKSIREKKIINEIRKEMDSTSLLRFLILNTIRSEAANLVFKGKLSMDFFKKVFISETNAHWSEANRDYIMNY